LLFVIVVYAVLSAIDKRIVFKNILGHGCKAYFAVIPVAAAVLHYR